MLLRTLSIFMIFSITTACGTSPSKDLQVWHDPLFDQNGGTVLIVDVCIQRDALGDADDYFVIEESKAAAQALLDTSVKYLAANGVQARTTLIPFVCGVLYDTTASQKKVADHINGTVSELQQPFDIESGLKNDTEYLSALSKVSTYAVQKEVASVPEQVAGTAGKNHNESGDQSPQVIVSPEEFKAAAAVIAARTHASSELYLNVAGTSISTGKALGQSVGGFFVAMGTAIATAGLGTGYYAMFMPGRSIDGRFMGAAAVDLESGEITWSKAVYAKGDPIKPDVVAEPETLNLLLFDLVHRSAAALSLNTESVQVLNALSGHKAQVVSMEPPSDYNDACRGSLPIRTMKNGMTIHRYVQESFNNALNRAGIYDADGGISLFGTLSKIEFSSGTMGGWWELEVSLSTEDGRSMTVKSHYNFDSAYAGDIACNRTKEALDPAVQQLIKDTVSNPKFEDLLTKKVAKLGELQ